jgi:hypothetical protein
VDDLARGARRGRPDLELAGIRAAADEAQRVEVDLVEAIGAEQVHEVDRSAHRRPVAELGMAARLARDVDRERVEARSAGPAATGDDLDLLLARLIVQLEDDEPVGEPARQPGRADVVERVRGADDREPRHSVDAPEPRDLDIAVRHRGQERVERAAGRAVELLDVEDAAGSHRTRKRARDEVLGPVAVPQHHRRVERPDERVSGQLLVTGGVDEVVVATGEVARERANDRRLRDAGQPEQQDRLAALERAEQQTQLNAPTHDLTTEIDRQRFQQRTPLLAPERIIRVYV